MERYPGAGRPEAGGDLGRVWQMVRRRLRLAFLVAAVITGVATLVVATLSDRYTAEAIIALNDRPGKVAELQSPTENLLSHTQADLSVVKTETDILTSEPLLRQVARRLDLVHDKAFVISNDGPGPLRRLGTAFDAFAHLLPTWLQAWLPPRDDAGMVELSSVEPASADPLAPVVEKLGRAITVVNEGGSYAIKISAEAKDPQLAAKIANALVAAYLDSQCTRQAETRQAASGWLAGRLKELRASALQADEAVEQFRARNSLGQANAPSLLDVKMRDVNREPVRATVRLGRAQANLAQVEGVLKNGRGAGSSSPVLAAPTIQTLRQQEAEILVRRSALAKQYRPRHPAVAAIEAQLAAVRGKIQLEVDRIVASMRGEVAAAKGGVAILQDQLGTLERSNGTQADAEVKLADLERGARASREVYGQFLQQFNTTQAQEAGQEPDARLMAAARPPVEPSGPRRKLLVAGAGVGALGLSLAAAVTAGLMHSGFGGAQPLEEATGLPTLEMIPELKRHELKRMLTEGQLPDVANPIRSLAFTLENRLPPEQRRVLPVTSSVAGEGKSLLTLTLARAFAQAGRRTLLVDLDLWRPSLPMLMQRLPIGSTGDVLADFPITVDPLSALRIATARRLPPEGQRPAVIRRVLAALEMHKGQYDTVLLDAPPGLVVPDVLPAAARADATLFVVRFEGPEEAVVLAALQKLASVGARMCGTVLSRVNHVNYRRYGYGDLTYTRAG